MGKPSWRKLERASYEEVYEEVGYRVLCAEQHPDHDSIAEFRKRHLKALGGLFVQVLRLCQKAGLVKLGHVALDGTKVKANAPKHKAMSYERMCKAEQELEQEIKRLLELAEKVDGAEDQEFGEKRGDELPVKLARRESRLAKIRQAKADLEEEARDRAEQTAAQAQAKIEERRLKEQETCFLPVREKLLYFTRGIKCRFDEFNRSVKIGMSSVLGCWATGYGKAEAIYFSEMRLCAARNYVAEIYPGDVVLLRTGNVAQEGSFDWSR